ncbi:MAG TPA: ABC-type transport auxiliary lipoprotein family protein, partial [Rhizomicrobium sp.]|nr:ABC-type transport auxiliary lipoprotein family protein [Rhizomicrobium sp.]
ALKRGQTMDYYANSAWTDQTPDLLQGLLVEALEQSGKAKAVGRVSSGVRPDYILVTEVHDFAAHYDGEAAPKIVVDIVAKLVTATRHDVVGTYDAHREAQASANSVPAVVDAFNEASGAALEDIAGFVLKSAMAPVSAKPDDPAPSAPVIHRHRRHHHHY